MARPQNQRTIYIPEDLISVYDAIENKSKFIQTALEALNEHFPTPEHIEEIVAKAFKGVTQEYYIIRGVEDKWKYNSEALAFGNGVKVYDKKTDEFLGQLTLSHIRKVLSDMKDEENAIYHRCKGGFFSSDDAHQIINTALQNF